MKTMSQIFYLSLTGLLFITPLSLARAQSQSYATIQSAINACSPSGCLVQLDCTPFSDASSVTVGNMSRIRIADKHNLRIQGCGIDAPTLGWTPAVPAGNNQFFEIVEIAGTSSSVTFADMTLSLDVTCGSGSQSCGSVPSAVYINGNVKDVRFERVHFKTTLKGSDTNSDFPAGIQVRDNAGTPDSISVFSSKFETSGSGVNFANCKNCWIDGSYFEDAPTSNPPSKRAYAHVRHGQGEGIRITNNTLDMKANVVSATPYYGVLLWGVNSAAEGAQLVGNSFVNTPSNTSVVALSLYGYNAAIIDGNRFRCDPAAQYCAAPAIRADGTCTGPCNRRNVISNNVFDRFQGSSGICPILIPTAGGTNNRDNLVVGNLFSVSGATGVCGGNESVNTIVDNLTVTTP